jgi:hypothetical protein
LEILSRPFPTIGSFRLLFFQWLELFVLNFPTIGTFDPAFSNDWKRFRERLDRVAGTAGKCTMSRSFV